MTIFSSFREAGWLFARMVCGAAAIYYTFRASTIYGLGQGSLLFYFLTMSCVVTVGLTVITGWIAPSVLMYSLVGFIMLQLDWLAGRPDSSSIYVLEQISRLGMSGAALIVVTLAWRVWRNKS